MEEEQKVPERSKFLGSLESKNNKKKLLFQKNDKLVLALVKKSQS